MLRLGLSDATATEFATDRGFHLTRLLGVPCAEDGRAPATGNLFAVRCSRGSGDAATWSITLGTPPAGRLAAFVDGALGLALATNWTQDDEAGIIRRTDVLTNAGPDPVVIHQVLARVALAPGRVEVYTQTGRWGAESQGGWRELPDGELTLASEEGRTAIPHTPYACLKLEGVPHGLAVHVLPRGNWTLRIARRGNVFEGTPLTVIEAGLADGALAYRLEPGEVLVLPDVLYQAVPLALPHLGAAPLHRWAQRNPLAKAKPVLPLVYNTWFDAYDKLDPARVRRQLAAAAELGCEVFVIDAGWFGAGEDNWNNLVGDWREATTRSFRGELRAFGDEVRAAGLKFGLWMEAERVVGKAPVLQEHRDLLVDAGGGTFRFDLENPAARDYLFREMCRVVETYRLAWMKIDSNLALGLDPRGRELAGYYAAWFGLLDELRAKYPETVFEACSSGALRLDLHGLARHDCAFLSDNVTVNANLRLLQGAALRVPPGRITTWTVLRWLPETGLGGPTIHDLGLPIPVDADFAALVNMPGVLTFSGDPASFPPDVRATLKARIAWWKTWRAFIAAASTHLLTPPMPVTDLTGWAALQLSGHGDGRHLVFAYRLDDGAPARRFRLRGLEPARSYRAGGGRLTGAALMDEGLLVELDGRFRATVVEILP